MKTKLVLLACLVLGGSALAAGPPTPAAAPHQTAVVPTPAPIVGGEPIAAHPEWDAEYTRQIREATTGRQFITDLVDHLPASASVPTPQKFLGYIAGAEGHLTYAEDVARYMRALAAASPRVKVFPIGNSEEGREMILVAIADEATIADLDRFKAITRALADPRKLGDEQARTLIATGKPMYWATGAMHSPETGSPEMLMELAYRLAVEDTPLVRAIRANVITLLTPVLEVDGRDRMVDLVRWHETHPQETMPPLVYWGRYVAHDNNRDAMGVALALSRNVLAAFLEWHPQVLHDLHESVPFLYISTGTGPYNAWLDPLMIDEWDRMATNEVEALTAKGLPGVWTHGFYDGWAPNYMFWVAMGRNSIGRFYETFGNALPDTEDRVVRRGSERAWFRPNPPLPKVRWSLRDNVNYEQSGLLLALSDMAEHREHFLDQFYVLGKRSVAKARTEGPAAYVFDGGQKRRGQLRDLADLLRQQGIEVSVAERSFTVKPGWPPPTRKETNRKPSSEESARGKAAAGDEPLSFPAGSLIVRMDQPYSRLADTLLDTQYVRADERVYDDSGWTLGYGFNVEWKRIVTPEVLDVPVRPWDGTLPNPSPSLKGAALAIPNTSDTDLVRLCYSLAGVRMLVADEPINGAKSWPAGTIVVPLDDGNRATVREALARTSLRAEALDALPKTATHALVRPRIALLHTWLSTQDEGWFRLTLENLGVPYTYI
ncbi:MAG: M14 family zinc carboxypeptidase, partial [Thermoanaerobaculales bacterium]